MTVPATPSAQQEDTIAFPRLMAVSISTRLFIDTTVQIFSPFLAIFAQGLGVSVVTMGQLLSLRSIVGLVTPLIGTLADRYGYRRMMRLMILTIVGGLLLLGGSQRLATAIAGMLLMGIGLSGFVPILHAYLSTRLPYAIRARGLGILEYSWALAGILGLYAMGQLIAASNWRAPLFVLAGGLAVMWVLLGILPSARYHRHAVTVTVTSATEPVFTSINLLTLFKQIRTFFDLGSQARSAYGAIGVGMTFFFTGMQLFVTYGAWLNLEYGLGAAELGIVALILGCFDLVASVSVSLFTDRLGKLRSVLMGIIGVMIGYALIPFLNVSVVGAVVGIALTRMCFEFSIVSHLSLVSEQVPEHRGKIMSLAATFTLIGSTVATLTGPWLYANQGVWGLTWSSLLAASVAIVLLTTQVREVNDIQSF